MPYPSDEAELVQQALLEQEQWEAEASVRSGGGDEYDEEDDAYHQQQQRHERYEEEPEDEYKARSAAEEAVPPGRASELSARLRHGTQVAQDAASEIASRLASARAHARSARAAEDAVKQRSDEVMGDLKDRADNAKRSALAAVAAHHEAVAEVRQAADEMEHARMLADAASEVLELAQQETRAARASAAEYSDAVPRSSPVELAQLEDEAARSTAAAMAAEAAHAQAQAAVERGVEELVQLRADADAASEAAVWSFDAEDIEARALNQHRRQELEATVAELEQQTVRFEALAAEARAEAQRADAQETEGGEAAALAQQSAAKHTKARTEAMEARSKAADVAAALIDAEAAAKEIMASAGDSQVVDSPGTVRTQAEGAVAQLQAQVGEREAAIASLVAAVEAANGGVGAAKLDLESARTTAQHTAGAAAAAHQDAIAAHETAYQRARSARGSLSDLEQEYAQAQAAALATQARVQAASEIAPSESATGRCDSAAAAARSAQEAAAEATARVNAAKERLVVAEQADRECRAGADAAADEAAAGRLEAAAGGDDDATLQAANNACIMADQFLTMRQSRLDSTKEAVRLLESELQKARQEFAALTARAHSPRTEAAERTAAQAKKESLRAEKHAALKHLQATRASEATLQFIEDTESVTLVIQYNAFYGAYDDQKMFETLTGIGAPEAMAKGVCAWLSQPNGAVIKGPLRKARAIMSQLQAVQSLNVGIAPTDEQIATGTLQAQRAGVDINGAPGAEELALEQELYDIGDDDDTDALLEAVLVSDEKEKLVEESRRATLASMEADQSAADAAADSSAANWGAAASADQDAHMSSPVLIPLGSSSDEQDPVALVDRMSELQTELDAANRVAEAAREEFGEHKARQSAAHAKRDALVKEKEEADAATIGEARARVADAEGAVERSGAELMGARDALAAAQAYEAECVDVQQRAEDEAAAAQSQLESTAAASAEIAEAEAGSAACNERLETLAVLVTEASADVASAEQAEAQATEDDSVRLAQRVSAEVVGRSVVDCVGDVLDQAVFQAQDAQRALEHAEIAVGRAKDEYNAAGARVATDVSVAMSMVGERKAAAAALDKVEVLRQTADMAVRLAEQRSMAAAHAAQEFELASELEARERDDAGGALADAEAAVQKYSDKLAFLREEVDSARERLEEFPQPQPQLAMTQGHTGTASGRGEDQAEAIAEAEVYQREAEFREAEAAATADGAARMLADRKEYLEQAQPAAGAGVAAAEEREANAEQMLQVGVEHLDAERNRLSAAESAESQASQQATLKKAEAARTAEGALSELAKTREQTLLASHARQAAEEAVSRLEAALQQAESLAHAARENEDEARALAIASPGTRYTGGTASSTSRTVASVADDAWEDLTVYESAVSSVATDPYGDLPYGERNRDIETHFVHRTDSGGMILRLSSPVRETPTRKTTISFGPDRFDDDLEPPSPKWVPASTGGGSTGNPDYGMVSTHAHATGSARSSRAERVALDISSGRPPSPELMRQPATRVDMQKEALAKREPYAEPWTVHQKGHHLNRARPSPQRQLLPAPSAGDGRRATPTRRRPGSEPDADPWTAPATMHQKGHHLNRSRPSRKPIQAAADDPSVVANEATFERLSSPVRARPLEVRGPFAHPEDYTGDTHGHTFGEAAARMHTSFKRRPEKLAPATGASMNEESLYDMKAKFQRDVQPRYMKGVQKATQHGHKKKEERDQKRMLAEAKKVADELAEREALEVKEQLVDAAARKGKKKLGLSTSRGGAGGGKQSKREQQEAMYQRSQEQRERTQQKLEEKRRKEKEAQEREDSRVKWGKDVGRLWACVNVLYKQLQEATGLFEQVMYEVRTGQDHDTGEASPRGQMRLEEAFEDVCAENPRLTLSAEQCDGLFRVLNHQEKAVDTGESGEREAFYRICCHHEGLALTLQQCGQLLALIGASITLEEAVGELTKTFKEGKKWSAAIKMGANSQAAVQQRWEQWELQRNDKVQSAKRRKEEEIAETLLEAPALGNSFAKRAPKAPDSSPAAATEGGIAEVETTEPGATAEAETMRAPVSGRRKPPSKSKPAWEVAGYRGLTPAQVGRAQTPQKPRTKQQLEESGAAPPRVYGLHTSVSQAKSTNGALEDELRRQAEWRASTVPNLSRSFASVSGPVGDPFAEPEAAAGAAGAKLKAKGVKQGMEVQLQVHKQLPPQFDFSGSDRSLVCSRAVDRTQRGKVLKKAGRQAQIDFSSSGGEPAEWFPLSELETPLPQAAPATPGGAEDVGVGVEASPTLSVASSAARGSLLIPPESQLAKSVSTLVVKLRSLSYGTSGQDPVRIFRHYDRNNRGGLDQRDFMQAVRKGGALTRSQISDTEVRLLFKAVDKGTYPLPSFQHLHVYLHWIFWPEKCALFGSDDDGFISIDELRTFVWGGDGTAAAEAVEVVEQQRHRYAAPQPQTVHSFAKQAPPPSPLPAGGRAAAAAFGTNTPTRRAGSPKPALHER